MSMTRNYPELINDLRMFPDRPLMARAAKAIDELLTMHELDQSEIVRLRRQVEMKEDEKWQDLREGNRAPYREEKENA